MAHCLNLSNLSESLNTEDSSSEQSSLDSEDLSSDSEDLSSNPDDSFANYYPEEEEFVVFKDLLTNEKIQNQFKQWFWDHPKDDGENNGNRLITILNTYKKDERIRREKVMSHVYGIVVNNHPFNQERNGEKWKLLKIGCTQKGLCQQHKEIGGEKRKTNLIDEEVKNIKRDLVENFPNKLHDDGRSKNSKYESRGESVNVAILFVSEKSPFEISSDKDWSERTKHKFGKVLTPGSARELGLPYPDEWVFTTQKTINRYKTEVEKTKNDDKLHVSSALKGFKMVREVREQLPNEIRFKRKTIKFK